MTVRIMRFTKLLLGLGLAACAWPLSGQNARQEIYADPDKAGGVYYAYTYDNPARTPAPEGYEPFYISHYGRHGSRWLLRASEYTEVLETFGKAAREGKRWACVLCRLLDRLDPNHCEKSIEYDEGKPVA